MGTVVDMVDQDEGKPYLVEFAVLEGREYAIAYLAESELLPAALPVYGCLLLESTHFLLRVFDNIPAVGLSISSVLFRLLYINSHFVMSSSSCWYKKRLRCSPSSFLLCFLSC